MNLISELKRLFVGQPLASDERRYRRLSKRVGLGVFGSIALSSVTYATEAILITLLMSGTATLDYITPTAIGITLLLLIVAFSYREMLLAYPQGGGGYRVVRDHLGEVPSLVAAASLLVNYILTVTMSVSAAMTVFTSMVTIFANYRVEIAVGLIAFVTIASLRGIEDLYQIFAIITYIFVFSTFTLIGIGLFKVLTGQVVPPSPLVSSNFNSGGQPLPFFVIVGAFASGCALMTGIETITDGVPVFRRPESRNAVVTLVMVIVILCTMFLGITVLVDAYKVIPNGGLRLEPLNAQLPQIILGQDSPLYYVLQIATILILIAASSTAFASFPLLSYFLAQDRLMPRQFAQRGDRLVFSNGIVALGIFSSLLVIAFDAKEQVILPLYVFGAFISFTFSQLGMVQHTRRLCLPGWRYKALISSVGTAVTGIVLTLIAWPWFLKGAWTVISIILILILILRSTYYHYINVARQLSLSSAPPPTAVRRHTAIVLISAVHRGVIPALQYGLSIAPGNVTALLVGLDAEATEKLQSKWQQWGSGVPLVVIRSPYWSQQPARRWSLSSLMEAIDDINNRYDDDVLTVILPEFTPAKWWQYLLSNETELRIKGVMLFNRGKILANIPYHFNDSDLKVIWWRKALISGISITFIGSILAWLLGGVWAVISFSLVTLLILRSIHKQYNQHMNIAAQLSLADELSPTAG